VYHTSRVVRPVHPVLFRGGTEIVLMSTSQGNATKSTEPESRARCEAQMGRSDIYVKVHQLSDAQLIKLLQFQGDDDSEADSLSVMVEEEIARRKAGGGRLQ
jgi:hypothetical protein